jgi:hypothetical protein
MATKDERPGLLSKVAMFVRNPTKDWSELDQPEEPQESGYDKQALKAMIERKRQNDFVRRREFDQLRKLRNRDPGALARSARPSFFQTSVPTDPDGRAVTLKKIDEIEAQMSKQWWKGKQEGQAKGAGFPVAQKSSADSSLSGAAELPTVAPEVPSEYFEQTQAADMGSSSISERNADFQTTEMGRGTDAPSAVAHHGASAHPMSRGFQDSDIGFSTSKLMAMEVAELTTDPELEEAAIRFANGDDGGAENGLLLALRGQPHSQDSALSWAAALFDFYRATNQRDAFDRAMEEFGGRFEKLVPQWFVIAAGNPQASSATPVDALPGVQSAAGAALWRCPAELTVQSMEALRDVLGNNAMPWHLDWSGMDRIAVDAMPLLAGLFSSLCNEPVALRFSGSDHLIQTLRALTPSGDKSVDASRWNVRLDVLRTLQMQDEFELAALDYCVTYEVSPPAWQEARCTMHAVVAPSQAVSQGDRSAVTVPMGLESGPEFVVELQGEVLGDATQALAGADVQSDAGGRIVVSCRNLVRVDFSAAGSILNWVARRQAQGQSVQFREVHRLVAAFFNVIGINEHARVVPRTM